MVGLSESKCLFLAMMLFLILCIFMDFEAKNSWIIPAVLFSSLLKEGVSMSFLRRSIYSSEWVSTYFNIKVPICAPPSANLTICFEFIIRTAFTPAFSASNALSIFGIIPELIMPSVFN